MQGLNRDLINNLGERIEAVEKRLPQLERNNPAVNVPALNELRYSLVHLMRYLRNDTDQSKEIEAENAFKHAKRAYFDCSEAEALYYFKEFGNFEEQFKEISILDAVSDYIDWGACFEDLRNFMQSFSKEERERYCDGLEEKLVSIREIHNKLKVARLELLKIIKKEEIQRQKLEMEKSKIQEDLQIARQTIIVREASLKQARLGNIISILTAISALIIAILK